MLQHPERNSTLTEQLAAMKKHTGTGQFFWLAGKHLGRHDDAAADSRRFAVTGAESERLFKSAVAIGDTTSAGWAAELAYSSIGKEWIKSVVAGTILDRLDYIRVPFFEITISDAGGVSAGWVGEGQHIPLAQGSFGQVAALGLKKIGTIVPFVGELFATWTPATGENLQDVVGRSVRFAADKGLLDPDLAETAASPASLTNGIAPKASSGSTAANAVADFQALIGAVLADCIDPSRILIIMAPSTALHYAGLQTTGGLPVFPNLGALGGSILGVPVVTSKAAERLGSPAANIIAAIDGGRVLVADDGRFTVDASTVAGLQFTDAPVDGAAQHVSLYQTDTRAIRVILFRNFIRAADSAVAWMASVY